MQSVIAFFMFIFTLLSSFFTGKDTTHLIPPWQKPSVTVSEKADVLELYRQLGEANKNTVFQGTLSLSESPAFGSSSALVKNLLTKAVNDALANASASITGLPGKYKDITAADLESAKAEYFNSGKTLRITLIPKAQTDTLTGPGANGSVGRTIGAQGVPVLQDLLGGLGGASVLTGGASLAYQNPQVVIVADAKTLAIVEASFGYDMAATLGGISVAGVTLPSLTFGARYDVTLA
ncbi:MAG: hypothetical protein LBJ11_05045 [Oscillospiraceae bacterium]|nr:hypothetical protein [Oscillospiraceae bacterium]